MEPRGDAIEEKPQGALEELIQIEFIAGSDERLQACVMVPMSQISQRAHVLLDPRVGIDPRSCFSLSLRLEQDSHAANLCEQEQVCLERLLGADASLLECLDSPFGEGQRSREELWTGYGKLLCEPRMTTKDPPELSVARDQPITPVPGFDSGRPFPEGMLHHPGDEVFLTGHVPIQRGRLGLQQMSDSAHRDHFHAFGVGDRDAGGRDPFGIEPYSAVSRGLCLSVLRLASTKAGRFAIAIFRHDGSDSWHWQRKSFGAQYRVHPAGRGDGDVTGSHDLSRRGEKVSR